MAASAKGRPVNVGKPGPKGMAPAKGRSGPQVGKRGPGGQASAKGRPAAISMRNGKPC